MHSTRRSDYDVTNTVLVSSAPAVCDAIRELYAAVWPGAPFDAIARACHDFEQAFTGRMPGYFGVDTVYHDQQHSLDVTLAMARLLAGYEITHRGTRWAMGAERAAVGLVMALFHDIGYLREVGESASNGAEFTRNHVSRSARFIEHWLPRAGLGHWAHITSEVVHFTGYERSFEQIGSVISDPRDIKLGHLLGTADMIAQMADRCYLEKCRDRLYPEFVLGGVAVPMGGAKVRYASGLDLLRQTPGFILDVRHKRLEAGFDFAYRYVEPLFAGRNPYIESIERTLVYLQRVLRSESWRLLRRTPRVFAARPNTMGSVRGLVTDYINRSWIRS